MELQPNNPELGEYLLLLNKFPGGPVSDEEALVVAKKILAKNPANTAAREVILGTKTILDELEKQNSKQRNEATKKD